MSLTREPFKPLNSNHFLRQQRGISLAMFDFFGIPLAIPRRVL
ncbi:hypothetical protein TVNIR_2232 [Thioalkalivibrio nitratireducens DSM 14787]|uniref:Uncharacterized protein n=1 Tax=Thioalkalivibrio nitratireducens (strain DSM 14787 / UNIQEM 213 / ALEN2) TaxID=1255043 RepID=L0DXY7_THIND|nr:hypothetical protein TVNIR_2232 [Thioalkalivibrio nitratireducens DSM 14787]